MSGFVDRLRGIVGAPHVLAEGDLLAYEQDWRQRVRGRALAVVRPADTQQVAQVVRACADAGHALVPQGGNTGMVAGGVPDASGREVVLSLSRMQAIRGIDAHNLTMTVEAGCVLQVLQEAVERAGFLFPLSLAAQGSCTIGGNLATNAGGTQVLRYGNARELCLGLEVVTAGGQIWQGLGGLRKDNTGYDLRDLFIGSEGTLGVITAATMKLYPLPAARLTAWAAVPSLSHAVQLLGLSHRLLAASLTGFEVMGQGALALVARHFPHMRVPFVSLANAPYGVLIESSDAESEAHARERFESLLEAAFSDGLVVDAVVAESIGQGRQLWHARESIPLAQSQEGPNIKHDISLPVSRIAEFVSETDAQLQEAFPSVRLVNFGHLGDGNLHYNVQPPLSCDAAHYVLEHELRVNACVYDAVERFGGSISAEHGVGSLKVGALEQHKGAVAIGLMQAIKRALDPAGTLNPGRVLRPGS